MTTSTRTPRIVFIVSDAHTSARLGTVTATTARGARTVAARTMNSRYEWVYATPWAESSETSQHAASTADTARAARAAARAQRATAEPVAEPVAAPDYSAGIAILSARLGSLLMPTEPAPAAVAARPIGSRMPAPYGPAEPTEPAEHSRTLGGINRHTPEPVAARPVRLQWHGPSNAPGVVVPRIRPVDVDQSPSFNTPRPVFCLDSFGAMGACIRAPHHDGAHRDVNGYGWVRPLASRMIPTAPAEPTTEPAERCNCEHGNHCDDNGRNAPRAGYHDYRAEPAGAQVAKWVGRICDACAADCLAEYLRTEPVATTTPAEPAPLNGTISVLQARLLIESAGWNAYGRTRIYAETATEILGIKSLSNLERTPLGARLYTVTRDGVPIGRA